MKATAMIALFAAGALLSGAMWQNAAHKVSRPPSGVGTKPGGVGKGTMLKAGDGHELAVFGGGCFWGLEDRFRRVPGVTATAVGYTGGTTDDPTYSEVCNHTTGHAEAVLVEFDPKKVSYDKLVTAFWTFHNPTTLNRQGPDVGDNYRSVIWYFNEQQRKTAVANMQAAQKNFKSKIVTSIEPAERFWIAEDYHQQYHQKTGTAACPIDWGG
jgi:peptide-methionine (S)-S-oxide reductase